MWRWLVQDWHWPAAALFAALFLLALTPFVAGVAGLPIALVFVQLPVYMVHQWEEHRGDRFRRYVNETIGGGREALTPTATFWINALGVWAVDLTALYLAWAWKPAAGLVAGYLALFNALMHLGPVFGGRGYNPGLITAIVLFLPLGGWCVVVAGAHGSLWEHALGLAGAVLVHALIVVHVVIRLRSLRGVG
jgi:hypothetical protein